MERKDLLSKFKDYTRKKEDLLNRKYAYAIDIPCMQLGKICGMSMQAIKTAYCVIDEMTCVNDKMVNELNVNVNLFSDDEKKECLTFEGFSRDQWIADLKTRVSELQNARRLEKIEAALPIIEKWLSDDDLFALDSEKIEKLLTGLELD